MLIVRKYTAEDAEGCADCFYESFFHCPIMKRDRIFLHDYAQVLLEKCSFTYVAEYEGKIVGFITGYYNRSFDSVLAGRHDVKRHYGLWARCFLKFLIGGYRMSGPFEEAFGGFYRQARERDKKTPLSCDCELMALCSRRDYRGGLGTALWNAFAERCGRDGAKRIRVFTNTDASYLFYEKRGFTCVWEKPYSFGGEGKSLVYEYKL